MQINRYDIPAAAGGRISFFAPIKGTVLLLKKKINAGIPCPLFNGAILII
jgi:hypothetical protein